MKIDKNITLIKSKIDPDFDYVYLYRIYNGVKIYHYMRSCTIGLKCGMPKLAYVKNEDVVLINEDDKIYEDILYN